MLANLKVGQKILAMELLVALVLATVLLLSYSAFRELRDGLAAVRDNQVPDALLAKDMQLQVVQVQQFLTDISATRGQNGLDDGLKEAEKAYAAFQSDLAKLRASYQATNEQEALQRIDRLDTAMSVWYGIGKHSAGVQQKRQRG